VLNRWRLGFVVLGLRDSNGHYKDCHHLIQRDASKRLVRPKAAVFAADVKHSRNYHAVSESKNAMKKIPLRLAIAIFTFLIGVAAAGLWTVRHYSRNKLSLSEADCIPKYFPVSSSANKEAWNSVLDRFQEMPFDELPSCVDEGYRLIWIPTFHAPLSARIWRSREKQFLATKQLDGRGGYGMGQLASQNIPSLSDDEWNEFMHLLRQSGYWDLPSNDDSLPPFDGATWIIEGIRNGKHHQVNRRSPSSEFREACVYLVKLSGLKTEIERY